MKIKSKMILPLGKGTVLKPGTFEYDIDYKDPMIAELLRQYRKHGAIQFEELLACDVEFLKKVKGSPAEKAARLKAFQGVAPTPVKRMKVTDKMKEPYKKPRATRATRTTTNTATAPKVEPASSND